MRITPSFVSGILVVVGVFAAIVVAVLVPRLLFEKTLKIAIHQGVEGVALKEIVAKYAHQYGVSVEVIELPYDKLYASEMRDVSGEENKEYDVIMLDDPWMPALATATYMSSTPGLHVLTFENCDLFKDFVESTLKVARNPYHNRAPSCTEKFYALPFVGNSQLFIYGKPTENAPSSWNKVVNDGYVMRVGSGNQIVTDFIPMLWEFSAESFAASDDPKSIVSLKPAANAALDLLGQLGERKAANLSIVSQDDFDLAIHLVKKKASMSIIWSAWAMAMRKLPEPYRTQLEESFKFADMPGGHPVLGVWLLAIPKRAPHEARAREFVWFATGKRQIIEAAVAGNPPSLKSVLEMKIDDALCLKEDCPQKQKDADAKIKQTLQDRFSTLFPELEKSLEKAAPRPRTRNWKQIESALGSCLSGLYESTVSADNARNRANHEFAEIEKGISLDGFNCKDKIDEKADRSSALAP